MKSEGYGRLLGRAETFYRSSAATLRTSGQHGQAEAAERYAAWARFHLEDPRAARRMRAMTEQPRDGAGLSQLLPRALEQAYRRGTPSAGLAAPD